ncbi:MAG: PAS domain-containing protein [Acidimicrobiia bacterium]
MAQKPIELILLKDLVSQLGFPVTMVDADGRVIFLNQPAEELLGRRHDDTGELPIGDLAKLFAPLDENGDPLPLDELPIRVALRDRRPQQGQLFVHDVDGKAHRISTTSIPLDGQGGTLLGAMAIYWETDST